MTAEIRIPKAGVAMTHGAIDEWLVSDGDQVEAGQPIYVLEADKALMDIEAPSPGTIRIVGQKNESYEVGTLIARIEG